MLHRLKSANQRWRQYAPMLIAENRWRAQRYGIDEGLIDFGKGEVVGFASLVDELIDMVKEDAEALDCLKEIKHLKDILTRGTSAHKQVETYNRSIQNGNSEQTALNDVVDMLIKQTRNF